MISEQRLERALHFLADTDEPCAEFKADVARKEYLAKRVRARMFIANEGNVELRKAKAETSTEVLDAETALVDAIVAYEKVRAKRQTEELIVEVFRTLEASRRQGSFT